MRPLVLTLLAACATTSDKADDTDVSSTDVPDTDASDTDVSDTDVSDSDTDASTERTARAITASSGDLGVVVDGNEAFHWDVYQALTTGSDDNLFVSTFSMSAALGMTYAGSAGTTHDEMADVLHVDLADDPWHEAFGELLRDLSGAKGRGYTLEVANRLFAQPGVPWDPGFLAVCRDAYDAPVKDTDFIADPSASRALINDWVSDRTADRIPELMPDGSVTTDTRLVLVNAIYFLADWAQRFDPADTRTADFHRLDGSTVSVDLMSLDTADYEDFQIEITSDATAQVARLPYQDDELSMLLIVPTAPKGLAALEATLDAATIQRWVDDLQPSTATVALPKLELRTKVVMGDTLKALGMGSAFTDAADFSAMTTDPNSFMIQDVWHEAYVRIDEAGTEAAAATAVGVGTTSLPPQVIADHPFLFLIRDDLTGSTLFAGRVTDPSAE